MSDPTADDPGPTATSRLQEEAELLHAAGMLADAEILYRRLLERAPNNARVLHQLGVVAQITGRSEEALGLIDHALAINPSFYHALNSRGVTLAAMGCLAAALDSYDTALTFDPNFSAALANRGDALLRLERHAEALASFERAIAHDPANAQAVRGRYLALGSLDRPAEVVAACDALLVLGQDVAVAHVGRAHALFALGRHTEAAAGFAAATTTPTADTPQELLGRAVGHLMLGQWRGARAAFHDILRAQPNHVEARFNRALCDLALGDFTRGWHDFEWRWQMPILRPVRRAFAVPQWTGADDIAGKTILLYGEQGFGDTLQFARYAPLVAARADVVLEVPGPLVRLMTTLPASGRIIAAGEMIPDIDVHCPLLSLPRAFNTTVETIPGRQPYVAADPSAAVAWRHRLRPLRGLRVGLCWAGNARLGDPATQLTDRRRSMPMSALAPLSELAGVDFISLRKGSPREHDGTLAPGCLLYDWTEELQDFADTAALIEGLDLVITVDTAVAHLAGALGKPVWILNRFDACWRWLEDRLDSPWYPTARLFRQPSLGDWASVVLAVREELTRLIRTKPPGGGAGQT